MSSYENDSEARSARFLDGFEGLVDVLQGQVPGLEAPVNGIAALLSILFDEAKAVVPSNAPRHQPRGAND